jgi:hypothetical protein
LSRLCNTVLNRPSTEWEKAPAPGILDYIAARARDLAAKLGYIRNLPPPPGGGSGSGQPGAGHGFQCMKSLDEPVLVDGVPVLVAQPEDCYQGRWAHFNPNINLQSQYWWIRHIFYGSRSGFGSDL